MSIKRIVPNIESKTPKNSIDFYKDFLGLKVAMDMDWIITFISESVPTSQVNIIQNNEPNIPHPDVSIEIDDVDQMFAKAKNKNITIVYPITNEPWGVRRFFVKDPNGKVINILSHLKQSISRPLLGHANLHSDYFCWNPLYITADSMTKASVDGYKMKQHTKGYDNS
jgi:uncharacterized glyoxalase superfamily protein PhnB